MGGCCCSRETKIEPINTKVKSANDDQIEEDEFDGPLEDRSCRDVLFLLIMIAFIGGMGYFSFLAFLGGNPNKLLHGTDSWGNVCAQPNIGIPDAQHSGRDMTQKTKVYYFDFTSLANPLVQSLRICVSDCPSVTSSDLSDLATTHGVKLCRYDKLVGTYPNAHLIADDECPATPIEPHVSLVNRCIPKTLIKVGKSVISSFSTILNSLDADFVAKVCSDISNCWQIILYLCAIAFGISLIVIFLLKFFACLLIWIMVIGCVLGSLAASAYCWYNWYGYFSYVKETELKDASLVTSVDIETRQTWLIYASVVSGIALIVCLVMLVMRKRIQLVVQLFMEAGSALGKIPMLLFQPIWTIIILIGTIGGLLYIFAWMHTSAPPIVKDDVVTYEADKILFYTKWYHVFGMLWISQFILACQQVVIAGAIATWYFKRDKSKMGFPICASLKRLICYHLGSVAFGSLIIAIVQLARMILGYIHQKVNNKPGVGAVAKFILKCLKCLLWCFEKFLKYLNRNAYIEIAIYGYSFCKSAKKAFLLLVANVLRVAAINSVGFFVLFLAKVGTVAIVGIVGLEFIKIVQTTAGLNFFWVPLLFACSFAFFISHCFLQVYEMTIDTIFLCFCEDCERNDGVRKPYFMSKGLMAFVENSKEALDADKERKKTKALAKVITKTMN
ncbi:unnamed protein product [Owenia fusiformis]|uniref:Choline transporter-like protein n=1 Tax=Owenia fusiformis TaxID=6347 RepID=A0A8J1V058_OWEFU|nr:unnamed protein product [Owenia fusiformis]